MATKKTSSKKTSTKKTSPKKRTTNKSVTKPIPKSNDLYSTNISIIVGMAVEALILLLGYLIIMSIA